MKQSLIKLSALAIAVALLVPASMLAQEEKDKVVKEEKVKDEKKKDGEQIIITRKGDKNEKIVVEIVGDKITVNGKPIEELKDGDFSVSRRKINGTTYYNGTNSFTLNNSKAFNRTDDFKFFTEEDNHAMLGVTTEKTEQGAKINDITKESAAEKIGLKEGDVIIKIDDTKIEDPDCLSKAIRSHKPGEKVTVTYLRDNKEQKLVAELTKWKSASFKMDMGDMNLGKTIPRVQVSPRTPNAQSWVWSGGSPKLGLSVQDTDDGKGVKVIEVDEDSNAAKAGVKENDVIVDVDGKAINSTDEMVKMIKESKEKNSIMVKLTRGGKVQNIEVKMPKKIKVADM
jgi:serine protease Do